MSDSRPGFGDLVATMARLRAPGGCPWDREQTSASLRPYLLEEAYETLDAIESGVAARLKEELGDLLLQVVFHAQMAAEAGAFTIDDVVAGLVEKLIRRHPHVFGDARAYRGLVPEGGGTVADTPDAVIARWDAIKRSERAAAEPGPDSRGAGPAAEALGGLARTLPALMLAQHMQSRAERAGHRALSPVRAGRRKNGPATRPEVDRALTGVREALDDLARGPAGGAESEDRVGDLLFAAVNAARVLHVDGELALRRACGRFESRFARLESLARARGKALTDYTPAELRALWREARAPR